LHYVNIIVLILIVDHSFLCCRHITAEEAYKGEKQPVGAPRKFYAAPTDVSLVAENERLKVRIKELEDDCKHHLRREDVLQWKRVVNEILDERQMEVASFLLHAA
jgi:hypothetical protein